MNTQQTLQFSVCVSSVSQHALAVVVEVNEGEHAALSALRFHTW